jgi:hypothetical protein
MPMSSYAELQSSIMDWLARPNDPLISGVIPDIIGMFEEEARDRLKTRFNETVITLTPPADNTPIPLPADFVELRELYAVTSLGNVHFSYQTPANMDTNLWFCPGYPVAFTIEGLYLRIQGNAYPANPSPAGSVVIISDTPPLLPQEGWLWWDSVGGQLYIYYIDQSGPPGQWVPTNNPAGVSTGPVMAAARDTPSLRDVTTTPPYAPPTSLVLDYMAGIPALSEIAPTNWLLQQYPSLYLFGSLTYAEPYIGDDPRFQIWGTAREAVFNRIQLADRKARYPGSSLIIQTDVRNP